MKHRINGKFILFLMVFCVFLLAGWKLYQIYNGYYLGAEEYGKLEKYIEQPIKKEESNNGFPNFTIDFEKLSQVNGDLIAWIYMKAADINYPVVQTSDNDFYLYHTFEQHVNSVGCIFMDCNGDKQFQDYNTFLYGHNMKNGSMFGTLKKLRNEPEQYEEDPYFYIYTEKGVGKYFIYSYYITEPDSEQYNEVTTKKEYASYIEKARKHSEISINQDISEDKNTVTLSTCSSTGDNPKCMLLHGILVDYKPTID